jgi:2-polyprenyl-3-methyl-5-hydroxy-6-metoxy-1,4-benzoquinol methylase
MSSKILRRGAGILAGSPLFQRGKDLCAKSSRDWSLPLSKFEKLLAGSWLILEDYSKGVFPPVFLDQEKAYQAEKNFRFSLPGANLADINRSEMTKPFWLGRHARHYWTDFNLLAAYLDQFQIRPPARLLELGCGNGWMSEFLAAMGFEVCGTTISESDVANAIPRIKSLEVKGLSPKLSFLVAPMESVHTAVPQASFDAVFVYEALHHAFNWRQALQSGFQCLKNGGWLLICAEPNVLHTCISYRVAKLSNAHEIGFRKGELIAELKKIGFQKVNSVGPRLHFWVRHHWLLAQK